MNKAEGYFEEYCRQDKIGFRKIEEGKSRIPDYELFLKTVNVIAEIKEFEHGNEDDIIKSNKVISLVEPLGLKRIRDKIRESSRQFRKYQDNPTLLILCNPRKLPVDLSTKIIKMAMFGDLSYEFTLDLERKRPVDRGSWKYGRNAPSQVSRKIGGSLLSAVAVLERIYINKKMIEKHLKDFSLKSGKNGLKKAEIIMKMMEHIKDIKTTHPNIDFNKSKLRLRIICNPFSEVSFPSSAFGGHWNEVHLPNNAIQPFACSAG